jgi:hypothetical protein
MTGETIGVRGVLTELERFALILLLREDLIDMASLV